MALMVILVIAYTINKRKLFEKYMTDNTPPSIGCPIDPYQSAEGLAYFKTKKIIVCGLVRDSSENVDMVKSNITKLAALFKDFRLLVVENDSTDSTRRDFLDWGREDPRVVVLGCGVNAEVCHMNMHKTIIHTKDAKRIRKMVAIRNVYMEYIAETRELDDFDFVLVTDLDIVGTFYVDGFGTSGYYFKTRPDILALCASGMKVINWGFYTFASYADPYAHKESSGKSLHTLRNLWIPEPERCEVGDGARKVKSCFSGFTMYRKEAIDGKKYTLEMSGSEAKCEHVTLNATIDGVFINPSNLFVVLRQ